MKKVFLTIVVTMLVMLVIGNGLALVYLSHKCDKADKEIYNLKLALASKGIVTLDEVATEGEAVTISEPETPKADAVEELEDNKDYKKYMKNGLEGIEETAKELPNYYAAMAIQELLNCNFEDIEDSNWDNEREAIEEDSKDAFEDMVKDLPKNVFKIVNSEDDIDTKIENLEQYGYLAYPVLNEIYNAIENDTEIKYSGCEISEELSIKEVKALQKYVEDIDLSDKEKEAVSDYVDSIVK